MTKLLRTKIARVPAILDSYVPSKVIVPDNAAATANYIPASERILWTCTVSELIGAILFINSVYASNSLAGLRATLP